MRLPRNIKAIREACENLARLYGFDTKAQGCFDEEPMHSIEFTLHEFGHAFSLGVDLDEEKRHEKDGWFDGTELLGGQVNDLTPWEQDADEATATAWTYNVMREIGFRIALVQLTEPARGGTQNAWSKRAWYAFVEDRLRHIRGPRDRVGSRYFGARSENVVLTSKEYLQVVKEIDEVNTKGKIKRLAEDLARAKAASGAKPPSDVEEKLAEVLERKPTKADLRVFQAVWYSVAR